MMKVALVIFRSDPARGGAERYTADLAAALNQRGLQAHILSSDGGVRLAATGLTRRKRYKNFCASLQSHLAQNKYDIVHAMLPVPACHVYHPHAGLAARTLAHVLNFKRRRFATVERELLGGINPPVVLCLSQYVMREVREAYPGLPPDKLETLFNGVDLAKFDSATQPQARQEIRTRYGITSDHVLALMIAQDFERKGLAPAIAALAGTDLKLRLMVVGKEKPEAYAAQAKQMGVSDRVIFAGSTDNPGAFYQAADLFVLPTRHDPCSLVVLESLAMGVPVISTKQNGACEIMGPEHGVVLADGRDVAKLREAYQLMLDDAKREAMRTACLALRPTLSSEAHVDKLIGIYRTAATKEPRTK